MTTTTSLETVARDLLKQEWLRLRPEDAGRPHQGMICGESPPAWVLPDLLAMIEASHDQPVSQIAPMIQRWILEQQFVDENGDGVLDHRELEKADQFVDALVRVLEKVRQVAIQDGLWSDVPVTPQMFG